MAVHSIYGRVYQMKVPILHVCEVFGFWESARYICGKNSVISALILCSLAFYFDVIYIWNHEKFISCGLMLIPKSHNLLCKIRLSCYNNQGHSVATISSMCQMVFIVQPSYSLRTFTGHFASVMSLDFHPSKEDLICSCDGDSEIRYWSINNGSLARVSKVRNRNVALWLVHFLSIAFI